MLQIKLIDKTLSSQTKGHRDTRINIFKTSYLKLTLTEILYLLDSLDPKNKVIHDKVRLEMNKIFSDASRNQYLIQLLDFRKAFLKICQKF